MVDGDAGAVGLSMVAIGGSFELLSISLDLLSVYKHLSMAAGVARAAWSMVDEEDTCDKGNHCRS